MQITRREVSSMKRADERFFQKDFKPEEFAARRRRLLDEVGSDAHVLLRGRCEPHGARFLQSKVFFYLSGIEIPNALLLISGPERKTTLYLPHRDPEKHPEETGLGVEDAEEIRAATGVDDVCDRGLLAEHLAGIRTLYMQDAEDELPCRTRFEAMSMARRRSMNPWDGRPSDNLHFISLVKTCAGNVEVKSLTPIISEMRRVKSEREIEMLRRAGYLSTLATTEAMRVTRVGLIERQLSAVASYIYYTHGATGEGYSQIIAAGNNMQFGHYSRGDTMLADGDIVLVDTAPDYGYYTSDIGRIWPVNGSYAPWQRELYGYITAYHKTLLDLLKPGAMAADIVAEAARIMAGVVQKTNFSKEIYQQAAERGLKAKHPLSHPVGLSVHDGSPYKHKPLEPGVVLSVDPMMTVPEEELYIRCEDTVLITEDGIENLTGAAPLDADDIEATMKEDGRFPLYDRALEWDPGRKV
jgi:Xaa-Pro aminopeptidase